MMVHARTALGMAAPVNDLISQDGQRLSRIWPTWTTHELPEQVDARRSITNSGRSEATQGQRTAHRRNRQSTSQNLTWSAR